MRPCANVIYDSSGLLRFFDKTFGCVLEPEEIPTLGKIEGKLNQEGKSLRAALDQSLQASGKVSCSSLFCGEENADCFESVPNPEIEDCAFISTRLQHGRK